MFQPCNSRLVQGSRGVLCFGIIGSIHAPVFPSGIIPNQTKVMRVKGKLRARAKKQNNQIVLKALGDIETMLNNSPDYAHQNDFEGMQGNKLKHVEDTNPTK